jgi:hypothetical protein
MWQEFICCILYSTIADVCNIVIINYVERNLVNWYKKNLKIPKGGIEHRACGSYLDFLDRGLLLTRKWCSYYSIFSFICMFCRSLFVLLYFFFWPLCCLFFFDIRILITPLVSFGHCVVCSSSLYGLWLPIIYFIMLVVWILW